MHIALKSMRKKKKNTRREKTERTISLKVLSIGQKSNAINHP